MRSVTGHFASFGEKFLGLALACAIFLPLPSAPAQARWSRDQQDGIRVHFDWYGTWNLSYKKELLHQSFPWDFLRMEDAFEGDYFFSVSDDGTISGVAQADVSFRYSYDGCSISHDRICTARCNGGGELPQKSVKLRVTGRVTGKVHHDSPLNPQHPQGYDLQTIHLKLEVPADLLTIDVPSTCVGSAGTAHYSTSMSWFCRELGKPCAASGYFLEADLELEPDEGKEINASETGGGEKGTVSLHRTPYWERDAGKEREKFFRDRNQLWNLADFMMCLLALSPSWGQPVCGEMDIP